MGLRLIEPPLGPDADKLPTLAEVEAFIREEFAKPVPDYEPPLTHGIMAPRRRARP